MCAVWLTEHACENNVLFIIVPRLFANYFAHAQMIRVKGDREVGKEGQDIDLTLATENKLDREDSNRDVAR